LIFGEGTEGIQMEHRTVVVHDGRTYIVILLFELREGVIAVSVKKILATTIMLTPVAS
jgi:hypothetical protein